MKTWEILSLVTVALVVGMFSGPWVALKKSIRVCRFEVFVDVVDRMNWNMAPALTVLLPSAFLSLGLATLMTFGEFSVLFILNGASLIFFTISLLIAVILEIPVVRQIATWPGALTAPKDWQEVRSRWLLIHIVRAAFGFASLIPLLIGSGLLFKSLQQ
jgi:hypothetical protein